MNGSLYLFPQDPFAAPAPEPVLACLEALELAGEPLAEAPGKRVLAAGPGFAREVAFAGCSPHLRFAPAAEGDRDFCHLALIGPLSRPLLLTGPRTAKPRCPACRARIADWRKRIEDAESRLDCPDCGASLQAASLDWRQQAAVGRLLIELRNVFPGEATPSDRLLAALAETGGGTWTFAWAEMSPLP